MYPAYAHLCGFSSGINGSSNNRAMQRDSAHEVKPSSIHSCRLSLVATMPWNQLWAISCTVTPTKLRMERSPVMRVIMGYSMPPSPP